MKKLAVPKLLNLQKTSHDAEKFREDDWEAVSLNTYLVLHQVFKIHAHTLTMYSSTASFHAIFSHNKSWELEYIDQMVDVLPYNPSLHLVKVSLPTA